MLIRGIRGPDALRTPRVAAPNTAESAGRSAVQAPLLLLVIAVPGAALGYPRGNDLLQQRRNAQARSAPFASQPGLSPGHRDIPADFGGQPMLFSHRHPKAISYLFFEE